MKYLTRSHLYLLLIAGGLFTIAFLLNHYVVESTSARYYTKRIESDIQRKESGFTKIVLDTALLGSLASGTYDEKTMLSLLEDRIGYGIFIFEKFPASSPKLLYWNSQASYPPLNLMEESNVSRLISLANGYYVYNSKQVTLGNRSLVVEALIPVMHKYFVEIENLKKEFVAEPAAGKRVDISFTAGDPVKSNYGNVLFYLQPTSGHERESSNWSVMVVLMGIFLVCWFIQTMAHQIGETYGRWRGFSFLVFCIVVLRLFSYYYPEILNLRQFELFDPAIYGSSFVLSSLGDLLINALLFCWITLFLNRRISENPSLAIGKNWLKWLVLVFLLLIQVVFTFGFARILQSLVADAKISFNVTNFFSLTEYSFIGFIILATLALGYFFMSQVLLNLVRSLSSGHAYMAYIVAAFWGLLILTFTSNTSIIELNLYVLCWMLVFIWMMYQKIFAGLRFRLNVSEVLFWLFVFSFSMATVIIFENRKIEFDQRVRFAEKLSVSADPTSERLLRVALAYLDNDFLSSNYRRFSDSASNIYLKDSIINKNFSAYLDKYDTKIFTFEGSSNPVPLFNQERVSFDTLNTIFRIQGKPTNITDLRYYERSFDKFSYIYRKEVKDSLQTLGYLFVVSEPKRYKTDALIPELFKQSREYLPEYSNMYSYAIYNNLDLIDHYNEYPFATHLDPDKVPKEQYVLIRNNSYDELWYRHSADKVVVIAKKDNSFMEAITLFAWLFSAFLFMLAVYRLIILVVRSRFRWSRLRQHLQISIRAQIHSTIILVSLLSFLVIGVATILFFVNRYERNNQEKIGHTIQILVNDLQKKLDKYSVFNDGIMFFDEGVNGEVEKLMQDMSEIHGTDINLYDPNGDLRVSSNPLIFNKGVLSEKMNPEAYYYLHFKDWVQCITSEKMAAVNYVSIYSPIRNDSGTVYAYLNVPSYSTQGELKQEIANFLVTVINLNAFIFLVAGAIALFITNRITSSFNIIGQKMRDINLNRSNQEIIWPRKDEIGDLVNEYNKMVRKLDESAEALAKSEREGAWRQMARQVAHEIKNPLTPMKLSIQYLQKAIDNNSPNIKEMTSNVASTLVEQIDHLSKIASDFSQFANIGNPKKEVFDLHELLGSLSSLYRATENLDYSWKPVSQRVMVFADKTQLNRLFTNLLQNALEAADDKLPRQIQLNEQLNGEYITISVTDNGEGIPEQTWPRIFTPNFTTKSSGTGLGLAMSKSIVENAQGEIWFKTKEGEGTTFFVKLPLLRAMN